MYSCRNSKDHVVFLPAELWFIGDTGSRRLRYLRSTGGYLRSPVSKSHSKSGFNEETDRSRAISMSSGGDSGCPGPDPDDIPRDERKRLMQQALDIRAFPPRLAYPENRGDDCNLVSLFSRPVLVWVPEAVRESKRPRCVVAGCWCEPSVKERKLRVIEDVDCKYSVLYLKYQCTGGPVNGKSTTFSTLSSTFAECSPDAMIHLPFVLSKKMGFSKRVMEHVHEGILSPNGLSSALHHLERRRRNRYYDLLSKFAYAVNRNHSKNATYLAPIPPTSAAYLERNKVVSHASLTAAWLTYTELYSSLCELVMKQTTVKKVVRMDHSVKFCKRLKVWEGHGKRDNLADAKMLLLVQNEIGQIVGRRLTSSENKEETMQLLSDVQPQLESNGECKYLTSDNAHAVSDFVASVYGDSVIVKQDPFHVHQRFGKHIKAKPLRKFICKEIKAALYDVDRELRSPEEMETKLREVLSKVTANDLGCTLAKWNNTIEYNVAQIKAGHLHVAENTYQEGGGPSVRVVSTSQLEGFHSALKKLRAELGLRILDVFIVQHNIDVGARFGRNPAISNVDMAAACRAATVCKLYGSGLVASTPEQEFVTNLVSASIPAPQYRSATQRDFAFRSWEQMFQSANVNASALETNLASSRRHMETIRELLCKNATTLQQGQVDPTDFMHSLRMEDRNCEGATGLSFEEHELLRQVIREQVECKRSWSECDLVTTIMYNLVVASNCNSHIKLRRRSYRTLENKIKALRVDPGCAPSKPAAPTKKLFEFRSQPVCQGRAKACEQDLQTSLFTTLRESNATGQRRKAFCQIYDFASCVCDGVRSFSKESLLRRWDVLKKSPETNGACKIKLKVVRSTLGQPQSTSNALETGGTSDLEASDATGARPTAVPPSLLDMPVEILLQTASLDTSRLRAGDSSVAEAESEVCYAHMTVSPPVFISKDHMDILVQESENYKGRHGKSKHLMELFQGFYPGSAITPNQLRMRIRNCQSRSSRNAATPPAAPTPPRQLQPPLLQHPRHAKGRELPATIAERGTQNVGTRRRILTAQS